MKISKNLLTLLLIAIISMACSTVETDNEILNEVANEDPITEIDAPKKLTFELTMGLDKLEENSYNLLANMQLDEGAYYGSPYSNNGFNGLFNIEIAENDQLIVSDTLIETPFPVEVYDGFSDGKVRWVKEETNYKQLLTVNSQDDFEVTGVVLFVVEPVCSRYEVAFVITSKAGELSITQAKPIVANLSN
ncbi:MAG: hypothetical protein GQ574_13285 [Crocinitomix sp.]|nr:hypothetical protein [Crocinitomix sp.]